MWQRQIHARSESGKWSIIADRLRVVDDHEVVVVLELARRSARCSAGRSPLLLASAPAGLPWSALWIVFVTSKNSSCAAG